MKNMAKQGKIAVKKWGFGGKKGGIGVEKIRSSNQNRKAKWCKIQVFFLKIDKLEGVVG